MAVLQIVSKGMVVRESTYLQEGFTVKSQWTGGKGS